MPDSLLTSLRERLQAERAGPAPVEAGVAAFASFAAGNDRAACFRALRCLVDETALDDDSRHYSLMVAVHDLAVRRGHLLAPATDLAAYFDESFYLRRYEDVRNAVQAGAIASGFEHFISNGAAEGREPHAWRPVSRASDVAVQWERAGDADTALARTPSGTFALNFIGFLSSNMGLGVTARNFIRLFDAAGIRTCLVDLPVIGGRSKHDLAHGQRFAPLDQVAPHGVNLFLMNLKDIREQLGRGFAALQTAGRINIALPFWELPRLPPTWVPMLDELDLVIAASDFVAEALVAEANCPPVVNMGHPLYLPTGIEPDRKRFSIPEDNVVFLSSFDVSSDISRKNPVAAITAFEQAFAGDDRACLVVKLNSHKQLDAVEREQVSRLGAMAARSANVRVIHEILGYSDLMTLYASCDVFVSLHRAEGLGLCLMEMMTLGRPVIATGWSGNMSFTNAQNSCLVGYDFIPVRGENQVAYAPSNLAPGAVWADARVDEAAHWMRRLADEPQLREHIARTARSDMAEYQKRIHVRALTEAVRRIATRRGIALG